MTSTQQLPTKEQLSFQEKKTSGSSDYGSVTLGLPGHEWALPLCQGISCIGCDIVSEGASAQGDFTVSWAAPGTPGREAEGGCARRVPQSPHVPSVEQSREPPRAPNYARMSL